MVCERYLLHRTALFAGDLPRPHEFFDYAVCQVIEPFKSIANKLISVMNEEAYRKKEKLIERLSCLKLPDEDADREQR